jgi:hypothetical protein
MAALLSGRAIPTGRTLFRAIALVLRLNPILGGDRWTDEWQLTWVGTGIDLRYRRFHLPFI